MQFRKNRSFRTDAIPLYSRVESVLRNKILNGQLEPGEGLSSEENLANQFGVSQITVRTALYHLVEEGLILRKRGKGTFVADDIPLHKQFILTGGVYDIVTDALRYEVKPLAIETKKVNEIRMSRNVREFLNLTNKDTIGVVRRIRLLKGTPIYFLENFVPTDISKKMTLTELAEKPFLKIVKEKIGITIGRGEMYIEAVPADSDVANILGVQLFDPLILMQVYYWLATGEPFEIVNLFMRSEYFKYKVDLDAKGFEDI